MSVDLLPFGKFGKPHGVRGELRLWLFNPSSELLFELDSIWLLPPEGSDAAPERRRLERARPGGRFWIVSLEGVSGREDAEEMRHVEVAISPEDLPPLEDEDEYYQAELVGMEVRTCADAEEGVEEEVLGQVQGFVETGAEDDVMAVERPGGATRMLVPFVAHVVEGVDLEEGILWLRPLREWAPADD